MGFRQVARRRTLRARLPGFFDPCGFGSKNDKKGLKISIRFAISCILNVENSFPLTPVALGRPHKEGKMLWPM